MNEWDVFVSHASEDTHDVAELIGDSEQILRKRYAAWIPGRQDRFSRILQEAFVDRSKGKVFQSV